MLRISSKYTTRQIAVAESFYVSVPVSVFVSSVSVSVFFYN